MEDLEAVLAADPVVNPPVIVTAGTSHVVNVDASRPSCSSPQAITQHKSPLKSSRNTPIKKRKRADEQPPAWASKFLESISTQNEAMTKQLEKIASEEKRGNDLFEQFLAQRS